MRVPSRSRVICKTEQIAPERFYLPAQRWIDSNATREHEDIFSLKDKNGNRRTNTPVWIQNHVLVNTWSHFVSQYYTEYFGGNQISLPIFSVTCSERNCSKFSLRIFTNQLVQLLICFTYILEYACKINVKWERNWQILSIYLRI